MDTGRGQRNIVAVSSVIMIILVVINSINIYKQDISLQKERAERIISITSHEINRDFSYGITISEAIESQIIKNKGESGDFQTDAQLLMRDYVSQIEVVKADGSQAAYPEGAGGNRLDSLFSNKNIKKSVSYGINKDETVIHGPVSTPETGRVVVIMNPVYFTDQGGNKVYWGMVLVGLKAPDTYEHALSALRSFGYDYKLSTNITPATNKLTPVETSFADGDDARNMVSNKFSSGQCIWKLSVKPSGGWTSGKFLWSVVTGIIIGIIALFLLFLLMRVYEQRKTLQKMAYTDGLTGLLNRTGFMTECEKFLNSNPGNNVTMVVLDLDNFKIVNDLYGHKTGDMALCDMAAHLTRSFPEKSIIGRTGGDEFCVMITGADPEKSRELVEGAIKNKRVVVSDNKSAWYTISAGYADYPLQTETISGLLSMADEALYAAKINGRHCAEHYETRMSNIKREQLGFSAKSIAAGMPGAFIVYKADEKGEILFANMDLVRLFNCKDYADFLEFTEFSIKNMIHPDDYERVDEEISDQIMAQINDNEDQTSDGQEHFDDYVEYRIVTKDGIVKHVKDMGRLVYDEHYGNIFFSFIRDKETIEHNDKDFVSL